MVNDEDALYCDQADTETVRALFRYVYLRCIQPEVFSVKVGDILQLASHLDIDVVRKACGIEIVRQLKTYEMVG